MKVEHTTGSWSLTPRVGDYIDVIHTTNKPGAPSRTICRVTVRDSWANEQAANALKIAAVPEMLAALQEAHHMLRRDLIDDAKLAIIEQCAAAIEKATGEEVWS